MNNILAKENHSRRNFNSSTQIGTPKRLIVTKKPLELHKANKDLHIIIVDSPPVESLDILIELIVV
jgi:hypothetical protein